MTRALEMRREVSGVLNPDYATSLNNVGACHWYLGEYEEAIGYYEEAMGIRREVLGEHHADYSASLNNLGALYTVLGEYGRAIEYLDQALEIRREVFGEQHPDYAMSLNNLGLVYWNLCDYDKAIGYLSEALEIRKGLLGEGHPDYAASLNNLANCVSDLGDYVKAESYYAEASAIYRNIFGELHPDYATSLDNRGSCYFSLCDYDKAIGFFEKALEIRKEIFGEHHPEYARSLNNLGVYYSNLGDKTKAIAYHAQALEIFRKDFGEYHPDCYDNFFNMSSCYIDLNEYGKALECLEKATDICLELVGAEHPEYANCLYNFGYVYNELADYERADDYLQKALDIYRTVYGEDHPEYANCLNNLGATCLDRGEDQKALSYLVPASRIFRENLGGHHPLSALTGLNLGIAYLELGDHAKASSYLRSFLSIISDKVLEAFTYLPQTQRALYWNEYSARFTEQFPSFARSFSGDKPFLCASYDCALFSKGLLLNAEMEMRRLILESGDQDALALYDRLHSERLLLDRLLELPESERPMSTDSLETVCESLEREMQQKSRAFGDYTKNLSIGWKDVRSALGKRDIAIEFLEVPVSEDTTLYCALTLKPGYDAPHFVELFDLKDLNALKAKYAGRRNPDGLIYGDKALYDLVWKPLESELRGVKNIYFGPSGELYQTAIEYADNGRGPFSRQKNIYRLSSTRQLAVIREETERERSAVFGGLKYGASEATLLADSRKYTRRSMTADPFFDVDSLDIRGAGGGLTVADLPATESEAREIDALLRKGGLKTTLRMGEAGTEAAFKDLSGRRENIVHVATHGFYWDGHQARHIGERLRRSTEVRGEGHASGLIQEDASMTRSGLLFSGANNALRGNFENKEGVEDGILTAKEIAQLDFRGTDLLVLSACQTGLGEVSGEGVFGLQRGFKKAGVNTILMSLWEVDDEATRLLMTRFYESLSKGRTKSEALKDAQKAVKGCKEHDYSSPYYWAAFILLD